MRAYPRSRGATATELGVTFPATGLSPLARGNLSWLSKLLTARGLSPLARGNRLLYLPSGGAPGPIPARAGQPAPA